MTTINKLLLCFTLILVFQKGSLSQSGGGELIPEVSRFKPVDLTDMVDLFSGDFSYSLPLISVPAPNASFPLNLSYASGIKMNEEASWAGLGWTLNPGAINRMVRNIPDDFNGARHFYKYDFADDWDFGVRFSTYSLQGNYNTGTQILSGQTGLSLFDGMIGAGVNVNRKGSVDVGLSLGGLGLNYDFDAEKFSVDAMGVSISKDGASVNVLGGINDFSNALMGYSELVSGPMKDLAIQEGIKSAAIGLQKSISGILTDGLASWYIWWSPNRGTDKNTVYGTLFENLNYDCFTRPPISNPVDYLKAIFKDQDIYDRINFGQSLGNAKSAGIATDNFLVAAQGLQGSFYAFNEPYKNGVKFRFAGDAGADSAEIIPEPSGSSSTGSQKAKSYYQAKKIETYFKSPTTASRTGKIVSFVITKEDGTRYVFGQPVYAKYIKKTVSSNTEMRLQEDIITKINPGDDDVMQHYFEGESTTDDGFAISWLLTAILYPDYQPSPAAISSEAATPDINPSTGELTPTTGNGIREDLIPDDNAKGNWIRFNYKKYDNFYLTNLVYENTRFSGEEFNGKGSGPDGKSYAYNRGAKELYYLTSAETKTHVAVFVVSDGRTDSYESYNSSYNSKDAINDGYSKFKRLDEIALFLKGDVTRNADNTFTYNLANAINGWEFKYSQELCKGIPNSDNNGDRVLNSTDVNPLFSKQGKLTLKTATMYGKGKTAKMPPYVFQYYNKLNPSDATDVLWGKYKYDRWGYYKNDGTSENHLTNFAETADKEARLFNLKAIGMPTGGEIEIDYEAKKYLQVGKYELVDFNDRPETRTVVKTVSALHDKEIPGGFPCSMGANHWDLINTHQFSVFTSDYARSPYDTIVVEVKFNYQGSSSSENIWWHVRYVYDGDFDHIKETGGARQNNWGTYNTGTAIKYVAKDRESVSGAPWADNTSEWFDCSAQWAKISNYVVTVIVKPLKERGTPITEDNPKCGGGARVKSVIYKNGLGQSIVKNYKYLNWENNNISSGVASVEPPSLTKDIDDILEQFTDMRHFYSTGPFVCHSHVTVEESNGAKTRYKFFTPSDHQSELLVEADIPSYHHFFENEEIGNCNLVDYAGRSLGIKFNLFRYKTPYVIHDKSSYWGKINSKELISNTNKTVEKQNYAYKQSFDHPLSTDRSNFTRQISSKGMSGTRSAENYYVESFGGLYGFKHGLYVPIDYPLRDQASFIDYFKGRQIYISNITQFPA